MKREFWEKPQSRLLAFSKNKPNEFQEKPITSEFSLISAFERILFDLDSKVIPKKVRFLTRLRLSVLRLVAEEKKRREERRGFDWQTRSQDNDTGFFLTFRVLFIQIYSSIDHLSSFLLALSFFFSLSFFAVYHGSVVFDSSLWSSLFILECWTISSTLWAASTSKPSLDCPDRKSVV